MKRLGLVLACSLAIVLVGALLLRGQPAPAESTPGAEKRSITADGSATVLGKLDTARVYLGVSTSAKSVDAARAENARIVSKVREAILALDLKQLKTRTTDTRVNILHNDDQNIVGYSVSHSFTMLVKEADPDKLGVSAGRILDTALKNGVNTQGHIEFFREDVVDMQREAMSKAVENALANAKAYAAGANVKISGVTQIGGLGNTWYGGGGMQGGFGMHGGMGGATTSPAAGEWKVSQNVRIVCGYGATSPDQTETVRPSHRPVSL